MKEEPKKRKTLAVKDTKLGVTLVISAKECEDIGISSEVLTTDAISILKQKLGLKTKDKPKKETKTKKEKKPGKKK